ncbi:MAG: nicotinate (nicotinamide) nucleotide adenylyltransferase [Bacteroidota bacterium]
MKVGLFFGSFNPIHIGHLIIADTLAANSDLAEVWLVISPHNPFKKRSTLLHAFDRYDMVDKATYDNHRLRPCDIEFHMPQPSYTIDTLTYLQEKHPKKEFVLLMGSDNLVNFGKWKNYEQILHYYSIYVYPRPNIKETLFHTHPKVKMVEAPLLDISATYIRNCVKEGKSIRYLVDEAVEALIRRKKFYL